jgi:hypothetical protein
MPSRRRTSIEDDWSIGATKSLLGAVLLAERRYDEAEGMLLDAERDLTVSPSSQRDLTLTFRRLADLRQARGK